MKNFFKLSNVLLLLLVAGFSFQCDGNRDRKKVKRTPAKVEDIMKRDNENEIKISDLKDDSVNNIEQPQTFVAKHVLSNGMTVLVREVNTVPKVSLQLWYNVGSKDEKSGERGIAHLIEHMIFKGTNKLSESDINVLTHMLSASTNAFTSYDYTGYLFNIPTHHWKEALPIMADCMTNCSFKEDHLSSEMKAVIQELKMRKDNYGLTVVEELLSTIFGDHPYHYPIIGFKQDLWTVRGNDLRAFYKKHYWPNNATLVIVGNVNPEEAFKLAEQYFGHIPANQNYKKEEFYFGKDIISKSVTVYRDVKQPMVALAYVVPGMKEKMEHALDIGSWILGKGKGSRLYRKLVNELELVASIDTDSWRLFDHSLFFIMYEPKNVADINKINDLIQKEVDSIVTKGITQAELTRAVKKAQMEYYALLEDMKSQAYDIGKFYLATGDENYAFNYLNKPLDVIERDVINLFANYIRPSVTNKGYLLPMPTQEAQEWKVLQEASDEEDKRILSARIRTTPVEEPSYAKTITVKEPDKFDFPKAKSFDLANGAKVLYYNSANVPTITLMIELKARPEYDSEDMQGTYNFVMRMLSEGTENYSATQLAELIESRGMSFTAYPGGVAMTMLTEDLEKGLEILLEILTRATFTEKEVQKVRDQILIDIKNFWDQPSEFASFLIKQNIYKGHPYSKNKLGTAETIAKISRKDLINFYKKVITPRAARIAVVGDLDNYDLKNVFERTLGKWQGEELADLQYPALQASHAEEINYPINRDQVLLCFAGLSVDRKHPDYDKLFMFNQILGSGVLGSMHSRLFKLREETGLFYSIGGTLTANADQQPGMVMVNTLVSMDRLDEAESAIKNTLATVTKDVTHDEFVEARNAIVNSLVNNFESNTGTAQSLLLLERFGFPANYFDNRAKSLAEITIADMNQAVDKVLKTDCLLKLRIGRIQKKIQARKS